jgi:hypothetical protein
MIGEQMNGKKANRTEFVANILKDEVYICRYTVVSESWRSKAGECHLPLSYIEKK